VGRYKTAMHRVRTTEPRAIQLSPRRHRGLGEACVLALSLGLACASLAGCGAGEDASGPEARGTPPASAPGAAGQDESQVAIAKSRGLAPWHADFPVELELPPSGHGGAWYARSRREIVETVATNIAGGHGKEAWQVAQGFFHDVDDDTARTLAGVADRALQSPASADLLENLLRGLRDAHNPLLAEPALRALDHERRTVREAALVAMTSCGTPEAVQAAWRAIDGVGGQGVLSWVRAALRFLGDRAAPGIRKLLENDRFAPIRTQIIEEIRKEEPALVLSILDDFWERGSNATRILIAGMRHRVGRDDGRAWLLESLHTGEPGYQRQVLLALEGSEVEGFRDELMQLTISADAATRAIAARILGTLEGEQVDAALETMTLDPDPTIRQAALRALGARGRTAVHEKLLEEAATSTGSVFSRICDDLSAAGYPPLVDMLSERFETAEPAEQREYLRWISFSRLPQGFDLFRRVFLGEERSLGGTGTSVASSSVEFAALYISNLTGCEDRFFELFADIDRADYRRRGLMLRTIGEVGASGRDVEGFTERVDALMQQVAFDGSEIPQMRLLALVQWRARMGVEDVLTVASRIPEEEDAAARRMISDFLFLTF
jgi:hypothetical protein